MFEQPSLGFSSSRIAGLINHDRTDLEFEYEVPGAIGSEPVVDPSGLEGFNRRAGMLTIGVEVDFSSEFMFACPVSQTFETDTHQNA
jgi:hypothetical protein